MGLNSRWMPVAALKAQLSLKKARFGAAQLFSNFQSRKLVRRRFFKIKADIQMIRHRLIRTAGGRL